MNYIFTGFIFAGCLLSYFQGWSQNSIRGQILDAQTREPLPGASIGYQQHKGLGTLSDADGRFELVVSPIAQDHLKITYMGYLPQTVLIKGADVPYTILLEPNANTMDEVVIFSASLRETSKLESPVNVEVYTPTFFLKNPTPSLFESLSNINGVRPQVNCNICNTGDIHINGLEGPYTMVLIDGMPIVSGLSTVYGLTGIPTSLIDRMEIVKGPASTLYGSEAVGGLINIITKKTQDAARVSIDHFATSWQEWNTDVGLKFAITKNVDVLTGINYFYYQNPIDHNGDGFTDVTLQNRISVFNKFNVERKENRLFTMGIRYNFEDRWGGQMEWNKTHRGKETYYGESIYTNRIEVIGQYQLPVTEKMFLSFSFNRHNQNSYYGTTPYFGKQQIAFGQWVWHKPYKQHLFLTGTALRFTHFDDNTIATETMQGNDAPSNTWLPGIFVQDEISFHNQHKLLLGLRYDYNANHGSIVTPRFNYKWTSQERNQTLRWGIGNGYRVAHIFTEDHAALTGAREVVFANQLKPETSWNTNLNYVKKIFTQHGIVEVDATAFFTYFFNRILPDYETHNNKIIYDNLEGHSISKGISFNVDIMLPNRLKVLVGTTVMDVSITEDNDAGVKTKRRQLLTERFSGTWSISYPITHHLTIDYTGNIYGPMKLPTLGPLDTRPDTSPVWSIQNIQLTQSFNEQWSIYGGVKNLLNYTPPKNSILRAHDPFDKEVDFSDPNALTFDPSYMFAPNQGIRAFLGVRYTL
jgi:outer membrane receptor for ferrienterochelin and colicins